MDGSAPVIFLSYASADRERVRPLVAALEAQGLDVWWDREIPGGQNYSEYIAKQLNGADCVVVAWSQKSVRSEWVFEEAERGKRRRILIPVFIDDVADAVPLGFGLLQAIDLQSWTGDPGALEFGQLVNAILTAAGTTVADKPASAELTPTAAPSVKVPILVGLSAATLMALGFALLSNVYLTPGFPATAAPAALVTAPAALAVLVGSVLAVGAIAAAKGTRNWLAIGLLGGFGFEALVKGLSLLGASSGRTVTGALIWVLGGSVAIAAAALALRPVRQQMAALRNQSRRPPPVSLTLLVLLGAVLVVVASFAPFNVAHPGGTRVVAELSADGVDPLATAAAALGAIVLAYAGARRLAAGVLIALGIGSALLWIRYAGVPGLQWIENHDGVASPKVGGFLGIAGGLLILLGGWGYRASIGRRARTSAERGHAFSTS